MGAFGSASIKGGGYLKISNADGGTYKSVYKGKITP